MSDSENSGSGFLNIEIAQFVKLSGGRLRPRHVAAAGALAAGLVLIHPAIRGRKQCFIRVAILREDGGAHADPERHALSGTRLKIHVVDVLLELRSLALRLVRVAP